MTPTSTGDLRPVYLFDILEPFDLPEYEKAVADSKIESKMITTKPCGISSM